MSTQLLNNSETFFEAYSYLPKPLVRLLAEEKITLSAANTISDIVRIAMGDPSVPSSVYLKPLIDNPHYAFVGVMISAIFYAAYHYREEIDNYLGMIFEQFEESGVLELVSPEIGYLTEDLASLPDTLVTSQA